MVINAIQYALPQVMYLKGSWECISIGRGVPPGPPLVRASIKPRTTALLLAVPNSSRMYLQWGKNMHLQVVDILVALPGDQSALFNGNARLCIKFNFLNNLPADAQRQHIFNGHQIIM